MTVNEYKNRIDEIEEKKEQAQWAADERHKLFSKLLWTILKGGIRDKDQILEYKQESQRLLAIPINAEPATVPKVS